jgi:hypothetical protein
MAEALFRSGRQLMGQGDYAQACPKFAESNRIEPKLGTLLNLALCHERIGKTASAWAEYVQASQTASRLGQAEREKVAREKAAALEPGLPRVIVDAGAESRAEVKLDDQAIGPAAFATAIPVDPGEHVVRATAPGKKPFVESFAMSPGATHTVRVLLSPEDPATPAPPLAPETHEAHEAPAHAGSSTRRTWGLVVGGAGVALVGVGAYFGMNAFSMKHTAEGECSAAGQCTQAGLDAMSSMKTSETVSTITTLAGAAALAGGVYLVLTSSSSNQDPASAHAARLRLSPDPVARGVRMELCW